MYRILVNSEDRHATTVGEYYILLNIFQKHHVSPSPTREDLIKTHSPLKKGEAK